MDRSQRGNRHEDQDQDVALLRCARRRSPLTIIGILQCLDRMVWVAKFEVEVVEKAFISVKKTLTSLLFTVDQKFHFATILKFLSPSSHL
jgi:hypothetical protein